MTDGTRVDTQAVKDFILQALALYAEGRNEEVLKQNLVSHLPRMFQPVPLWVDHHVRGAEAMVGYTSAGLARRGFIDNLVGFTTIEYEHDLSTRSVFAVGFSQVHQHLAGRLNAGVSANQLVGILSDTLRWRAYRIAHIANEGSTSPVDPADLTLEEVARLDIGVASDFEAEQLADFLIRYLGREGSLPLAAGTMADDLGFDSTFCVPHLEALRTLVGDALDGRPDYAAIIERLWADFVSYLGDGTGAGRFDREVYVSELYLVTLAKLICANVIARQGLHSDRNELGGILGGGYFKSKGLVNLVEYDFFGWLNAPPHLDVLLGIAENIQRDLRAYDFESASPHDIFGKMLAQLAKRTQRLLLGQEWTPEWLAAKIASELVDALPDREAPRFIDMCCGSGSFLVEVVKLARSRLTPQSVQEDSARAELVQVATGFDIDPLAVLLAKVNWVVAARDWLEPFDGSHPTTIPVYLADSLFGKTPLGDVDSSSDVFELMLHDRSVALPKFLVTPEYRHLFDAILEYGYSLAMASAEPVNR
ncbi:MAG: N-6 DNA methylase [Acidimicrobiales bacterium]